MTALFAFFATPLGRVALIGAALLAWTVYQREQAADTAREQCQAETLQRTLDEITRQRDAAQAALAEAEERADRTAEEMERLENARDEAIQSLQERAVDSCVVPDDALERLRNIR